MPKKTIANVVSVTDAMRAIDERRRQEELPIYLRSELRLALFPYCLARLEDGSYIPLNRNYKPLGVFTAEWVRYEDHTRVRVRLNSAQIRRLAYSGEAGPGGWIYFYNDGCIPTDGQKNMAAYLERLACLMKLKVTPIEGVSRDTKKQQPRARGRR